MGRGGRDGLRLAGEPEAGDHESGRGNLHPRCALYVAANDHQNRDLALQDRRAQRVELLIVRAIHEDDQRSEVVGMPAADAPGERRGQRLAAISADDWSTHVSSSSAISSNVGTGRTRSRPEES